MGTYRVEWPCCGSATETEAWEPEQCPFCEPDNAANAPADPALLALAKLGARIVLRSVGDDGIFDGAASSNDIDGNAWLCGVIDGGWELCPGIADAIAALLAPDGAGEVAP